jgi:hypothetical protein
MSRPNDAVVGERYITPDGRIFEVVALDDVAGTVDIQYDDGGIDELDFDDWRALRPRSIDTSGDRDDTDYSDPDEDDGL